MFELQHLIRKESESLAQVITQENGKTLVDARGDVQRGLEVVEQACGLSQLVQGQTFENISRGIDLYSLRVPLGVVAGIAPFNFPCMIPLWMFPYAITCGNTMVLKPSEKVPGATDQLIRLCNQIGIPKGVINVVQGGHDTVKQICADPDIKAISFVGGNRAGEFIY